MLSSHTNWVQCGPNPGELVHRALWPPCRASLVDEARRWAPCRLSAIQAVCVCEVWSFAGFFPPSGTKKFHPLRPLEKLTCAVPNCGPRSLLRMHPWKAEAACYVPTRFFAWLSCCRERAGRERSSCGVLRCSKNSSEPEKKCKTSLFLFQTSGCSPLTLPSADGAFARL